MYRYAVPMGRSVTFGCPMSVTNVCPYVITPVEELTIVRSLSTFAEGTALATLYPVRPEETLFCG
jgi:hypothetical protein